MGVNDWIRKHNAKVAAEATQPPQDTTAGRNGVMPPPA